MICRLRRTTVVFVHQDDGALAEQYRPTVITTCVKYAYDSDVYNATDVDYKARSHYIDMNEVSSQFIVLLQFTSVVASERTLT